MESERRMQQIKLSKQQIKYDDLTRALANINKTLEGVQKEALSTVIDKSKPIADILEALLRIVGEIGNGMEAMQLKIPDLWKQNKETLGNIRSGMKDVAEKISKIHAVNQSAIVIDKEVRRLFDKVQSLEQSLSNIDKARNQLQDKGLLKLNGELTQLRETHQQDRNRSSGIQEISQPTS